METHTCVFKHLHGCLVNGVKVFRGNDFQMIVEWHNNILFFLPFLKTGFT